MTTAINEITQNGVTSSKTDQISARTVVLPNNFFAAYEALAVRLSASDAGARDAALRGAAGRESRSRSRR